VPRGARLDGPGIIHHIMTRGIERRRLFRAPNDYEDLLRRLDAVLPESGVVCFAWALMPNHIHLVVQRMATPVSRVMARVATGYAVSFNNRYRRVGHLFQNRFRSRVVRSTEDLLQLIRYVHMNPLRAGLVRHLRGLEVFPWCGHGALAGRVSPRRFHSANRTLALFGETGPGALRQLREWMRAGMTSEHNDPVDNDWTTSGQTLSSPTASAETVPTVAVSRADLERLATDVAHRFGVPPTSVFSPSKRRPVVEARALLCWSASTMLGMSGQQLSAALGIAKSTVSVAIARGRQIDWAAERP
jgi:REP element-mobilizing transposase RayT